MQTIAKRIVFDPDGVAQDKLTEAAQQLAEGKIGILPTRCLYGLGTHALNPVAVERIFTIKGRAARKPLLVLISDMAQVQSLAINISPLARKLMHHFWPGKVTFLLNARKGLPSGLVGRDDKVGIRLVGHPVAAALVASARVPLTGTSANMSNAPGCSQVGQIPAAITTAVDLIIDAGPLLGGVGSSVVDATLAIPQMRRQGALKIEEFEKALAELQ